MTRLCDASGKQIGIRPGDHLVFERSEYRLMLSVLREQRENISRSRGDDDCGERVTEALEFKPLLFNGTGEKRLITSSVGRDPHRTWLQDFSGPVISNMEMASGYAIVLHEQGPDKLIYIVEDPHV